MVEFIGKHEITRLLGSGGMGQVWLCKHATLKHDVAIKTLIAGIGGIDSEERQRFLREARNVALLFTKPGF